MKRLMRKNILLKRTKEIGTITGVINAELLEVRVDGTTFPVYNDDVFVLIPTKKLKSMMQKAERYERIQRIARGQSE